MDFVNMKDTAPEEADLRVSHVRDIELGINQPVESNEEDGDGNEGDQSMVTSKSSTSKSVIQVTVASVLAGGGFSLIKEAPEGVKKEVRAAFLVVDALTLVASLLILMIVVTISHRSAKVEYFIGITLWAAIISFLLTFFAAEYVALFPNH